MTQRRRIPFILLAALAMVFALATSVLAAGELNIKCEDKTVDLANTDTFEVAVKSSGTSTYATGMVDVKFDQDVFDLTWIVFDPIAPNNATYLAEDDIEARGGKLEDLTDAELMALGVNQGTPQYMKEGTFRIDFGDDLAVKNFTADDGKTLFTLTFKVKNTTKEGPFTITLDTVDASYLDAEGNLISAVNLEDGTISKGSGSTVKVTITNYTKGKASVSIGSTENNSDNSVNTTVDPNDVMTVICEEPCVILTTTDETNYTRVKATATENANEYQFDIDATDKMEVIVVLSGDGTLDGKSNSTDYAQFRRFIKHQRDFSEIAKKALDLTGDGKTNSTDYAQYRRVLKKQRPFSW